MPISNKLLLVILGVTLVFGAVAVGGVMVAGDLLVGQVEEKLVAIADYAMESVHRLFVRRGEDVKALAAEPELRAGPGRPAAIEARLRDYLRHFRNYAPYTSASYFALDRTRLVDTHGKDVGKRHGPTEYWTRISATNEYVLDVSRSESLAGGVFHLAHLVRDTAGNPCAVVVLRVAVDDLRGVIARPLGLFKGAGPFRVDLVDRAGTVLYSSHDGNSVLTRKHPLVAAGLLLESGTASMLLANPLGKTEREIVVCTRERADASGAGNGWLLAVSVPERAALAPMRTVRTQILVVLCACCLVALFAVYYLARTITRPLARLAAAVQSVGRGRLDTEIEVVGDDEVGRLSAAFNQMLKDVRLMEAELRIAATLDPLTDVYNRGKTGALLAAEIGRARRYRRPLSIVMVDIDHFKRVNDTWGHQEGDCVLVGVCRTIGDGIRATDALGRWGGEEFLVLLPETDLAAAGLFAEKIRGRVAEHDCGAAGRVTISCGVAELAGDETPDAFLARADAALYAAKSNGRNRVELAGA